MVTLFMISRELLGIKGRTSSTWGVITGPAPSPQDYYCYHSTGRENNINLHPVSYKLVFSSQNIQINPYFVASCQLFNLARPMANLYVAAFLLVAGCLNSGLAIAGFNWLDVSSQFLSNSLYL
jgi:hypothetical protein